MAKDTKKDIQSKVNLISNGMVVNTSKNSKMTNNSLLNNHKKIQIEQSSYTKNAIMIKSVLHLTQWSVNPVV